MKSLIFCALLGMAVALVPVYEPDATNSYQCIMCGDPTIRTLNAAYITVKTTGKILMLRADDGKRKNCKIQIRCVIQVDYNGVIGRPFVDWCSISIHQHKSQRAHPENKRHTSNSKYFRRYILQNLDCIGVSGQGHGQAVKSRPGERFNSLENALTFPRDNEKRRQPPWSSRRGVRKISDPECDPAYAIWIDKEAGAVRFRSFCCGWAVDFFPRARDTCVIISVEKGNEWADKYFGGDLEGICGNVLGADSSKDWQLYDQTLLTPNLASSMAAMGISFREGKHQSLAWKGSCRLRCPSSS